MAKPVSLASQVSNFWKTDRTHGVKGLILINDLFEQVRVERNWDALATFYAMAEHERPLINRLIRAAFGDKISVTKSGEEGKPSFHKSGFRFNLKWDAKDDVQFGNHYGLVRDAIESGLSFRSAGLHASLKKEMDGKEEKEPTELEVYAKAAFKVLKKNAELRKVGLDKLMMELGALMKAEKAEGKV